MGIPTTFYDEMTGSVDEGRAVDIVYLDFSKVFDTVSHQILIEKKMKYRLDKQTVRWTENVHKVYLEARNEWCTPGVNTESSPVQYLH